MTEKANVCMETLRKAAHIGSSFDCHGCPAYAACPTGTAGWNNECIFDTAADLIEALSAELEETQNKLSELLYYVTGGRFSKMDYSTDDMRRFVDDYNQSVCSECDELEEVKRERDGLSIMLTAAESAAETYKRERDAAVEDLRSVIKDTDKGCILCAHYHDCKGESCPHFVSGVGAVAQDGTQYPDFKWTCEDFKYGTCAAMENTPCNGCDFQNNWQWRGVKEEKDER